MSDFLAESSRLAESSIVGSSTVSTARRQTYLAAWLASTVIVMPKVKTSKFARPNVLKKIKTEILLGFITPHRDYLVRLGFVWPSDGETEVDCHTLARILAVPRPDMPPDLVDQLDLVDLHSEEQQFLAFESEYSQLVKQLQQPLDSPADVVMRVLRHNPQAAWKAFDKRALTVQRALSSFLAAEGKEFRVPSVERITKLEAALAPQFKESNRSEACRIHVVQDDGQCSLIIRHGEPVSRIGTITDNGESGSLLFRPERLDVAYYNVAKREWLISGVSTILKEMYREQIGAILHGSRHALSPSDRYTLEPLRDGRDWLNDHSVEGVRAALLKEITLRLPTGVDMRLSKGDVFAELLRQRDVHGNGIEFVDATFALILRHRKRTLHVKVNPLRNIVSGTGGISLVDEWLEDRDFIITNADATILANN